MMGREKPHTRKEIETLFKFQQIINEGILIGLKNLTERVTKAERSLQNVYNEMDDMEDSLCSGNSSPKIDTSGSDKRWN